MAILDLLRDHREIKKLPKEDLITLAEEIREKITSVVLKNGGHLASSLGAVELTLSLLRSFDPGDDRIIFDVGHQSYPYKILTGRLEEFHTLRQWGGVGGFPKRRESPFDHFETGHSSTSLSAALGFAKARDVLGTHHHVVAVIGDASLLNGLAFEALNYTRESKTKVIYVLNDNAMSISPRVGGMATHLARLSSSGAYNRLKKAIKDSCASLPRGQSIENILGKMKDHIKTIVKPVNIFDEMDINYWGPFDGHNIEELDHIFELAKKYDGPVLLHVVTVKGKGFEKAEKDPTTYHGLSPASAKTPGKSWSEAASEAVLQMAAVDERIVCLTAAMKNGSKLEEFAARFPDRFYDVGIAEGHMMTMAAGMAAGGLKPVVFIYSTFLQRAMDQLVHDVCLQNLPVVVAVDRAGFVGEDGETHQGLLDVSWARPIPNLTLAAPRDEKTLRELFRFAADHNGPTMIRFPRGKAPYFLGRASSHAANLPGSSSPDILEQGEEWALIGYGRTVELMLRAREKANSTSGIPSPTVVDLKWLKPFPEEGLKKILTSHNHVVVAEEGYAAGGVGEAVATLAQRLGEKNPVRISLMAVPDLFIPQGTMKDQEEFCRLTPEKVVSLFVRSKAGASRQPSSIQGSC